MQKYSKISHINLENEHIIQIAANLDDFWKYLWLVYTELGWE